MFATYRFNGGEIDSLNLKYLLLTEGIHAAQEELSPRYKVTHRLNLDDPYANDIFTLSDGRVVLLYQNPASRFSLRAADPGPRLRGP